MSVSYSWIYAIPGLLNLVFYIGALIFVASRRNRHPQAAWLATIGVGMLLLTHVGSWLSTLALGWYVDSGQFMIFNGLIQLVFSVARLVAMGTILAAVFVGRRPTETTDAWGATELPAASDNPYVPPRTG